MQYGDVVRWRGYDNGDRMMVLLAEQATNIASGLDDVICTLAALNESGYPNGTVFEKYLSILEVIEA